MGVAPVFVGASGPIRGATAWPTSITVTAADLPAGTLPYDTVCMWIVSFHQESKAAADLPFDDAQGPVTEWDGINLSNFTWREAVHSTNGSAGGSNGTRSYRQSVRVSAFTGIWPWRYTAGVAEPPVFPVTISPLNSVGDPVIPANGYYPAYAYWQVYLATYRGLRMSTNQNSVGFTAMAGGASGVSVSPSTLDVGDTNAAFVSATIQIHPWIRDSLLVAPPPPPTARPHSTGVLTGVGWTEQAHVTGTNGYAGSFKIADRIEPLTGFRGPTTVSYQAAAGAVVGVHASTFTLDSVYVSGVQPPIGAAVPFGVYRDDRVHAT